MCKNYVRTLTIAGSDSGGGAGIQADLKTFSALGCYGMSVVTALTAQNTTQVSAIHEVPACFIRDQLQAVFEDIGVDAVKIGMLHNADVIRAVAEALKKYRVKKIVLDPVMVAASGATLLQDEAITTLTEKLIPLAGLITPNFKEAELLLRKTISDDIKELEQVTKQLCELGSQAALLKGGHSSDLHKSDDCFYDPSTNTSTWFSDHRVKTKNIHGTGCTLSSAITAFWARGNNLKDSVEKAKVYVSSALKAGSHYDIGKGNGPVHHFWEAW